MEEKKRALIVSVSEYNNFDNLPFCVNDGEEIYKLLLQKLVYEVGEGNKLVGKVSYEEMKNAVVKFFTDSNNKRDDTLVFYFSGHGALDDDGNSYFACSETDPLLPYVNGIEFSFLSKLAHKCKSNKIVMILDCCYSGTATLGKGKGETDEEEAVKLGKAAIENKIKEGHGMYLLASSQGYQKSYPLPDKSYSVFTNLVIQGLKGHELSVDRDGYVTPESLDKFIHHMISQMSETIQKPIRKVQASGHIILAHHPGLAKRQEQTSQNDHLLQLLQDGRIEEFNHLRNSNKSLSWLDLSGKDFTRAKLVKANLTHAIISSNFREARLTGANMTGARFEGTNLSYCNLSHATLIETFFSNACLDYADLSFANLTDSKLMGYDPPGTSAYSARFSHAIISNSDLNVVYFANADMSFTDLSGTRIKGDLGNADLSYSNLANAQLVETQMSFTNLSHAIMSGANLSNLKVNSSIILGCTMYDKLACYEASFEDSIIDNESLVRYLRSKGALKVPDPINDKKDLESKLKSRGLNDAMVESLIRTSLLK